MQFGLGIQSDKRPEEYAPLGRQAEAGGFDVVSVYHDLLFQPAIAPLLLIAQATERVRVGPAALNPYTLHPVEIAGQIAALDAISNGRAYLGLVQGAWLDELGLREERPLTALREAVAVIRKLFAGDRTGFAGERFTLAPGQGFNYEPVRRDIPLLLGTWGRRTAAFAGEARAAEVKLGGSANPDLVPSYGSGSGRTTSASCSAPSRSWTRTVPPPEPGLARRWLSTSLSSHAATRRSSSARTTSRPSSGSSSRGRRTR